MGRPRTPTRILELKGAFRKNPQRAREREAEPRPAYGVGDPPERFLSETSPTSMTKLKIWREFVSRMPWLTFADWIELEIAVDLTYKLRRGELKGGEIGQLRQINRSLGGSAEGRASRASDKPEEGENAWAQLARAAKAG